MPNLTSELISRYLFSSQLTFHSSQPCGVTVQYCDDTLLSYRKRMGIPASHLLKGLLDHHDMMKDLAVDWRHLPKNRMCPSSRPSQHHYTPRYSPRYRSVVTTLLILLCIPIFFYHLIPRYTSATDGIISSLAHKLHPAGTTSSFCTKEVGSLQCCALYLAAAPCQDECRKNHMDRETLDRKSTRLNSSH